MLQELAAFFEDDGSLSTDDETIPATTSTATAVPEITAEVSLAHPAARAMFMVS